jgi:predicted AAA+ superfamily ATPase
MNHLDYCDRFIHSPKGSYFLFGPRGTGKSTWVARSCKGAHHIDLLEPDVCRTFLAHPEHLAAILAGMPVGATVVVDEIQRVPELLTVVHQHMEKRKDLRFVMTGSCARKLKRAGVDLLAGRAVVSVVHPFMASELGAGFDMARALRLGMLPLVWGSSEPEKTLAAYVMLYVREEVMAEGLLRDVGAFSRFLEAISFSHAGLLNLAEISRECEVSRKTVEGYVSVLEDMLLGYCLPVFSRRAKRQLIKQSKFYYMDCGVFRSVRPKGPLDVPEEMNGAALEGLVFQHLRAWIDYSGGEDKLHFWRTKSGVEVDFVVYGPETFCAIEVKNSNKIHSKDLSGLRAFRQDYPESLPLLLYRGKDVVRVDDIWCLPGELFLRRLKPHSPLSAVTARPSSEVLKLGDEIELPRSGNGRIK